MRPEEIDVSSNVFFPPGISLQPGQFVVKLFTGEDFPQSKMRFICTHFLKPFLKEKFCGQESEIGVNSILTTILHF